MESSTTPSLDILIQQIKTLLIFLQRPVVQQQLFLIVAIVVVGTIVSRIINALLRRRAPDSRIVLALTTMSFSVLTLALGYLTIFALADQQTGLVSDMLMLLWLVFAYQLIVGLLTLRLQSAETSDIYRRRIFLPLLLLIVIARLLDNLVGSLDVLTDIELYTIGDNNITTGSLLGAVLIFYIFITLAWAIKDIVTHALTSRGNTTPGVINTITTISGYVIISIGILLAIRAFGVDLSSFAIIGGGLSIGIGIGLQQIVSNFVSGIILMFEQSLRPGDLVKVNGELGVVEKLNIRSTVVRTFDNVEIIVPNESLLTSNLTTYTKSDRLVRVSVEVGVSYDSDVEQVKALLAEAANSHADVLKDPAPVVRFVAFGASSLDFRVQAWIQEAVDTPRVTSDLHFAIWHTLTAHDIEIPFPQSDLHLRDGWQEFVETQNTPLAENGEA